MTQNQNAVKEHLEAALSVLREQFEELERKIRSRGTGDHRAAAEAAAASVVAPPPPKPAPVTMPARIEAELTRRSMPVSELARVLGEPVGRVANAVRALKGKVHNVGTSDAPRWTWVAGDEISTSDLYVLIERLISEQPMHLHELVAATGARQNRISGVLVKLQVRRRGAVVNVGTRTRARWFAVPPNVVAAKDPEQRPIKK